MSITPEDIKHISSALVSARAEGRTLEAFPGPFPETLEEAYQVQDAAIALDPREIVGWKIGMVPPELREKLGAERLIGPSFDNIKYFIGKTHSDDDVLDLPVFEDGFIAIEAELMIEIGQDIAPGSVNTADGVEHLISNIYIGIEIASSPVPDLNSFGPTAIISDFGNNHGMIIGAKVEDWQNVDFSAIDVALSINGEHINTAPSNNVLNGQMAAMAFLIDTCAQRGITLPKGTFVCSGAITGVHEALVGATSTVKFGDVGQLNIKLVAIK